MKKMIFACLLITLAVQAHAYESVEPHDVQTHSDWSTYFLLGENTSSSRMAAVEAQNEFLLTIDFYADTCASETISLWYDLGEATPSGSKAGTASLRVDGRQSHSADALLKVDNDNMIITIANAVNMPSLIQECMDGKTLRFRLNFLDGRDMHLRFSLAGFIDAYKRASQNCAVLEYGKSDNSSQLAEPHAFPQGPTWRPQRRNAPLHSI